VDRRAYLVSGVGLMLLKYAVDAAVVWLVADQVWSPVDYLLPSYSLRASKLQHFPAWLLVGMSLWTLPFLWIGCSMTLRRAVNAGLSPWLSLLFFVPLANYIFMLVLAVLPSRLSSRPAQRLARGEGLASGPALRAIGAGMLAGLLTVAACTLVVRTYTISLFFGTPFVLGIVSAYVFNLGERHTQRSTHGVVLAALLCTGAAILLFALEGAVCLAMVLPVAIPSALLGGVVGHGMALHRVGGALHLSLAVLVLPALAILETPTAPVPLREVVTAIEVDAPPAAVWRHVVSFSELPEPGRWLFRLGIAYPRRARIDGSGVGAIRRCEFSTGAFVEPITVWEEPHRLGFDVAAQPPPLTEWSPYRDLHPPHLDGYFRSRRGEFRLIPLPGNRTRLEGSTWYELDIAPAAYWQLWADGIVHAIHGRVLEHVKRLAETPEPIGNTISSAFLTLHPDRA
jgi:hypothetical protein